MTLAKATLPDGQPADLPGEAPFPAESLRALVDERFDLPCGDPWLQATGDRGHAYLDASRQAWLDHPEYMDFLAMDSPVWDLKRAERDLYLEALGDRMGAKTVLDVGCGIGRLTQPFLDEGATVYGCDGDLDSLRRCAWYAAGRAGRLDLFWTSVFALPDVKVDLILAVEVLCYVEDPVAVLRELRERLNPGGALLLAMEARWGWATSPDAPADGLDVALGEGGPLELDDRFVHVLEGEQVDAMLEEAGFTVESRLATHYFTTGPLEALLPVDLSRELLLEIEDRARRHPVWGPLNRIWTVIATR
ncbi:MAG: class I SAM-dependent methyltransferase [Myxococcota bacterium]